jgi:short-chain fatty acids transporter
MISRLGLWIAGAFRQVMPDPFVIAVLLTAFTAGLALAFGFPDEAGKPALGAADKTLKLVDAWGPGFWDLLKFGMQMCLVLVTGHALAESRPVAWGLRRLAAGPRSAAGASALVALAACAAGVVNWGLGLIVGAVLAREVGRSAKERGVVVHYPLLAAAGYMGLLVFHGGMSGSAPLAMSTEAGAKAVLRPEHMELLAESGGAITLDRTLGSMLNLVVTGGMLVGLPVLFWFLAPRRESCEGMERYRRVHPDVAHEGTLPVPEAERGGRWPEWLDRTPVIVFALAVLLAWGVWRFVVNKGTGTDGSFSVGKGLVSIGLDQVNAIMFALGLVLHGSARSYLRAAEDAATGCAGIIIQFPIYAGIMAMMSVSGLTRMMAEGITSVADANTLPPLTFIAATLVGLFVPSGGAQWSIQGPIALQSGAALGVDPGAMVMAVGYGDELANMLQPFWALPLLAITGVKARDIVGYTAIAMVAAGVWMGVWLLVL